MHVSNIRIRNQFVRSYLDRITVLLLFMYITDGRTSRFTSEGIIRTYVISHNRRYIIRVNKCHAWAVRYRVKKTSQNLIIIILLQCGINHLFGLFIL